MTFADQVHTAYIVVMNDEEQYSIWLAAKKVPDGWQEVGFTGTREECLKHIGIVWKDMRPLSLRKKMAMRQAEWEKEKKSLLEATLPNPFTSPTVAFLAQGIHPLTTRPINKTAQELKDSILRQHVHIIFTDTRGTTCLSVSVDVEKTDISQANFETRQGTIHIEGTLVLDYIRIRCLADVNLQTLEGTGRLIIIEKLFPFK